MYKVKIFGEGSRKGLEVSINSWLEMNSIKLIDIKYTVAEPNEGIVYEYAMVIYEVINDGKC